MSTLCQIWYKENLPQDEGGWWWAVVAEKPPHGHGFAWGTSVDWGTLNHADSSAANIGSTLASSRESVLRASVLMMMLSLLTLQQQGM